MPFSKKTAKLQIVGLLFLCKIVSFDFSIVSKISFCNLKYVHAWSFGNTKVSAQMRKITDFSLRPFFRDMV